MHYSVIGSSGKTIGVFHITYLCTKDEMHSLSEVHENAVYYSHTPEYGTMDTTHPDTTISLWANGSELTCSCFSGTFDSGIIIVVCVLIGDKMLSTLSLCISLFLKK